MQTSKIGNGDYGAGLNPVICSAAPQRQSPLKGKFRVKRQNLQNQARASSVYPSRNEGRFD